MSDDLSADDPATDDHDRAGSLDRALLAILVCPLTRGPLRYDPLAEELISADAQLAYPVRDGVPVLLVDEARFIG